MNIKDLVNFSVANKDKYQKITINELEKSEVENIKTHTNIDLTGYKRVMDSSAINHVIKKHGTKRTEEPRGQIPVVNEDFEEIPEITQNYDVLEYGGLSNIERQTLVFEQQKADKNYIYVEEVRTKRKEVALQTLYIRKNKKANE